MKRFLNTIIGLTLFLSLAQPGRAEFTVVPGEGFDRQFNLQIDAGSSIKAAIVVKNLGNAPIGVKLYGADATHSNQGTFALTTQATEQKHIGTWVKFDEPIRTIYAKEEKIIPFSVIVPPDATPGNYGGGIAVETAPIGTDGQGQTKNAVNVSSRIFVKMFVDVPGEKNFSYEWGGFEYLAPGDMARPRFRFAFKNTGNTIVLAEPKIELKGFPPLKNSIIELPTATLQQGVELDDIIKKWDDAPILGFYVAEATTTFSEFDIASNTKVNSSIVSKTITINLTPDYIIVIMLVVIFGGVSIPIIKIIAGARLRKKCRPYDVAEGDTIESVAKARGIAWKKLAKINGLKPPYGIRAGQKILVPPVKKQ
ncbi:MAG TPA: LysM peptidoglycan-binding domain-containing protein [Candidatus Gracilibacteria bacterium]|nr:LysM peptidoglycan-binding domain-containing protein [Candidatus Gracilibacteria bacterium]